MGQNREYNEHSANDCQTFLAKYGLVVLCNFHTRDGGTYIHQDTKCVLTVADSSSFGLGNGKLDAT